MCADSESCNVRLVGMFVMHDGICVYDYWMVGLDWIGMVHCMINHKEQ